MSKQVLYAVKAGSQYFVKDALFDYRNLYNGSSRIFEYLSFDGKLAEETFNPKWYKIPSKPNKIFKPAPKTYCNYRYELINKSLESDKIPILVKEELVTKDEDGDIIGDFSQISSLYQRKHDIQENPPIEVEFEWVELMDVGEVNLDVNLKYLKEVTKDSYSENKRQWYTDNASIFNQEADKIIFPDIALAARPSKLSSQDSYKIIREFVKDNLNGAVAQVTSDYDFCFTVKKKVKLAKPLHRKHEIIKSNGRSYRPPQFKEWTEKEKMIEVFEMTHAVVNYNGYTVIPGFSGDSHEDLKNNIDTYLNELITFINSPLEECSCCQGRGVIKTEKFAHK